MSFNIQILSDKREHVCTAISRTVDVLKIYNIHSNKELFEATITHYKNLLQEEINILKSADK